MKTLYTAEALATGAGRDGHVRSTDGKVDLDLSIPQEMGGSGTGSNPEQLFAAGYAACFHSALQSVARSAKVQLGDSTVGALVGIGSTDAGGFQLEVTLEVVIPELPRNASSTVSNASPTSTATSPSPTTTPAAPGSKDAARSRTPPSSKPP
jgi:osmotically inducible protein OsmC